MNTESCVVCNSHQRFYSCTNRPENQTKRGEIDSFRKIKFFYESYKGRTYIFRTCSILFTADIFRTRHPFWKHPVFRLRIHCSLASFCTVISVCGDLRGDDGDRDALETGIAFRARSSRTHGRREHEAETRGWGSTGDECDQSKRQRK